MQKKLQHTKFIIEEGNILQSPSDVIINWTLPSLASGDETFFNLHKEGGAIIFKECQRALMAVGHTRNDPNSPLPASNYIPIGQAVITNSGILPARKILHVPIPYYKVKDENLDKEALLLQALANLYQHLSVFSKEKEPLRKIAFSPIPTKIYGGLTPKTLSTFISMAIEKGVNLKLREVKIIGDATTVRLYEEEFIKQTTTSLERFFTKIFG